MNTDTLDLSAAGSRTLSNAEVELLADTLEALGSDEAMIVEELDGFLTAVVCSPEPLAPADYLPEAFGRSLDALAAAGPRAQAAVDLVLRHRNALGAQFYEGEEPTPILEQDLEGGLRGHAWAVGFVRGTELRPEAWEVLYEDPDAADLLGPVLALAEFLEADEDERSDQDEEEEQDEEGGQSIEVDEVRQADQTDLAERTERAEQAEQADDGGAAGAPAMPAAQREPLIEAMMESVVAVYDYFRDERESALSPATVRREAQKVGRNDPCPCGSGRKYKHCCGR